MSSSASLAAAPATTTLSWIIRACQEYEQWSREWLDYSEKLKSEIERLRATIYELETDATHMRERESTLRQMIHAQLDLLGALKDDISGIQEGQLSPMEIFKADQVLPSGNPESYEYRPPTSPSEAYSAALLLAMADAGDTD
ncbi:hypothetical protein K4F52_010334 [Lecanicillium sp. MT-2017a]|nr:hypothetical protein K4F52_010334 [Lecanicillium sp. MT-2017a]